jgi:hypothetical protein
MDWLPDVFNLSTSLYKVAQTTAQTTAPTTAPTADELELVKQQMAFLQEANKTLAASFDRYVKMVQLTLATAGGIVGVIAVLGAAVSIKSLRDFYATLKGVEGKVRDAVDQEVALALRRDRRRLNRLEAILAREDIPERTSIDYVVPGVEPQRRPRSLAILLEILYRRGFRVEIKFDPAFQDPETAQTRPLFEADVVVLDLHHAGIDQNLEKANAVIKAVGAKVPAEQAALIVYGTARFYEEIPNLAANGKYCGASNGPLSFVARVLEAAYVTDAVGTMP